MNMKTMAIALSLVLAQGAVWADGVTRTLQKEGDVYHVTLSWTFSGSVESDLVIEEQFPDGWNVDTESVPVDGTLDATWFSESIARFAVNPTNFVETGSIQFDVAPGPAAVAGSIDGDWRLYLTGTLQRGAIDANEQGKNLAAPGVPLTASPQAKLATTATEELAVELPVAIKSFKMLSGSRIELTYGALPAAGRLVVEGCEGLGKAWAEITHMDVEAAADKVELEPEAVGNRRFMRMKLFTKEQK